MKTELKLQNSKCFGDEPKVLLCCIGKNENDYIREFVEHYRSLGFNHIMLYDNNDPDGEKFTDVIEDYINSGFVTLVDYRGRSCCQLKAYEECFASQSDKYDWIAFFDCDEFLDLGTCHSSVQEWLTSIPHLKHFMMIHVNWRIYDDNGLIENDGRPLMKRFTHPMVPLDRHVNLDVPENFHIKSIIRGGLPMFSWANPHTPAPNRIFTDKVCDFMGRRVDNSPFMPCDFSEKAVVLRHFCTKTITEYLQHKFGRGFPDTDSKTSSSILTVSYFFQRNERTPDKVKVAEKLLNRKIPTVSVIVPNYNHSKYLKERIDSILSQTYDDFELILLDDCSTDDSRDILLSYKDNPHVSRIILNDRNSGSPFSQWKKGIDEAVGKYVWIAESDDSAEPTFLEKTVAQLEMHPEAQICLTGSKIVDGKGNLRHDYDNEFDLWAEDGQAHVFNAGSYLRNRMLSVNSVYNASMVLFRKTGDSDLRYTKMRYCGDWLFWIGRIRKGKSVIEIHEKLNRFRKHGNNVTYQGIVEWASFREICIIKHVLCEEIIKDKTLTLKDKGDLYRMIKHTSLVSGWKRRKELFHIARKEYGVTFTDYMLSRQRQNIRKLLDRLH